MTLSRSLKTGLCIENEHGVYDRFAGRAIFPWLNVSGKVVAFGGRKLDAATKGVQQKYVNSPDSEIYHKERELYGIYQAKKAIVKEDCVYMVEGYTDVIAMHQCGLENVVANSGTYACCTASPLISCCSTMVMRLVFMQPCVVPTCCCRRA